jgi:hypothetical protein
LRDVRRIESLRRKAAARLVPAARDTLAGFARMMTIMPLSRRPERTHDESVTTSSQQRRPTTQLIVDDDGIKPLTVRHVRTWVRLAAGLRSGSLDRRLADGEQPESSRLLSARADALVSPRMRGDLAQALDNVRCRARSRTSPRRPPVSINRVAIMSCEREMQAVIDALHAIAPTPARGYAAVSRLLSDGAGPLFNPHRSTELAGVLAAVAGHLDPGALAAGRR